MIKRTVEVSTPGTFLSVEDAQLVIEREGQVLGRIPFEDLGILMVESTGVTYTHGVMLLAADAGAIVVLCGTNHLPAAMLLPASANSLHTERLRRQVETKRPVGKRLWRQIVQNKIHRQASALPPESPTRGYLTALAGRVRSGDPENAEGQAARAYWTALFGNPQFRRTREGPPPNNFLNYGYAVLRAAMARAICGAGFHPSLGFHHRNRYNPFTLADDLMEPYRTAVDIRARALWKEGISDLTPNAKKRMLEVLTDPVAIRGESGPLMVAVQRTVNSLAACLEGEADSLDLPEP